MNAIKKVFKQFSRGFTLFEVIIAMVVIGVCTGSTITVIEQSRDISSKTFYYYEARTLVNNTLEVFKYAVNDEQFNNGLLYLDQRFTREGDLYRVEVTVIFNEFGNGVSTFKAVCYKGSGHQLFKCYYEKR